MSTASESELDSEVQPDSLNGADAGSGQKTADEGVDTTEQRLNQRLGCDITRRLGDLDQRMSTAERTAAESNTHTNARLDSLDARLDQILELLTTTTTTNAST